MKDRPRQPHRGWECIATVDLNPDEAPADEVDYETCQVTTARPPPPPRHPRWEYIVQATADPFPAEDLDDLGRAGWMMTGVVRDGGLLYHYFMRPVRSRSPPP
jgi:hypothetical protein